MDDTEKYLRTLMERYTTENVDDPVAFEARIREFLALDDWEMEGYTSPDLQRDKSIKFEWGHNHDFGSFKLEGVLGDRHIEILTTFIDHLGLPKFLTNGDTSPKKVLDIGVWTGGTSLLLVAMGARVWTIEEVKKYSRVTAFLMKQFSILGGFHYATSLYNVGKYFPEYEDTFDYISFPGVLYHLSDPVLALRILFNMLKDGGKLFVESAVLPGHPAPERVKFSGGDQWNWFIPSQSALEKMVECVGFEDIKYIQGTDNRGCLVATRIEHKDMLRAGLSRRDIR